MGQQEKLPPIL